MISVSEAQRIIFDQRRSFGTEKVHLDDASGRVLAQSVDADRDFPPFDRVAMDGFAIKTSGFRTKGHTFTIQAIQPAGAPALSLESEGHAIEIMTGAIMPKGADAIIRYEDANVESGKVSFQLDEIKPWQNIHRQGTDRKSGSEIIAEGTRIGAAEIGVLATVGLHEIMVEKHPKIAVVSSGDELVSIDQIPQPHQIRRSNSYSVSSLLSQAGFESTQYHISDDKKHIQEQLTTILRAHDIVVLSGGVSMGKFDHLPQILRENGVEEKFHKVKQRPGKPFWFGASDVNVVFALPGNPVSTFMCAVRYLIPFLTGVEPQTARLKRALSFKPELSFFPPVKITFEDGVVIADPFLGNGSGDLANLVDADGFLELDQARTEFLAGEVFPLWTFR